MARRQNDNYECLKRPIFVIKTQFTTNIIKNWFTFSERDGRFDEDILRSSFHGLTEFRTKLGLL